jgi:hypothetical protein
MALRFIVFNDVNDLILDHHCSRGSRLSWVRCPVDKPQLTLCSIFTDT